MAISMSRSKEEIVLKIEPVEEIEHEQEEEPMMEESNLFSPASSPYVPKFRLLAQPLITTQSCSNASEEEEDEVLLPSDIVCPKQVVILLKKIDPYSNSTKVKATSKLKTWFKYRGRTIRPLEFHILLRRVQILRDNSSSISSEPVSAPVDKSMLPQNPTSSTSQPMCLPNNREEPSVKIEVPETEMEYDLYQDPSLWMLEANELQIPPVPAPVMDKIVQIPLERIDHNILFRVRINNPDAVIPVVPTKQFVRRPPRSS